MLAFILFVTEQSTIRIIINFDIPLVHTGIKILLSYIQGNKHRIKYLSSF